MNLSLNARFSLLGSLSADLNASSWLNYSNIPFGMAFKSAKKYIENVNLIIKG